MKTYKVKAKIGDKVYAVSRISKDGKETSNLSIYEARVNYIGIVLDEKTNKVVIEYILETPNGKKWGDTVLEHELDTNFDVLMKTIKKEWLSKSNTF